MTLYVISEALYHDTSWHNEILNGLMNRKKRKRYNVVILSCPEEIEKYTVTDDDVLIISSTNSQCTYSFIDALERLFENRIIVLGNRARGYENANHCLVTSDIPSQIDLLVRYFKYYGRPDIALYGFNPISTSDKYRKTSFCSHGYSESDIYENNGSLAGCFDSFYPNISKYGAVICVNDYAAISLVKRLSKEEREALLIASCGNTSISKAFEWDISGFELNYENFGKSALTVQKILQKSDATLSVDIYIKSTFVPRASTKYLPVKTIKTNRTSLHSPDPFYQDPEVSEMLRIENLLNSCDSESLKILLGILNGKSYPALAEELFMSVSGIKYRLKNMLNICDVSTKKEFIQLINKYISKEKLYKLQEV